MTASHRASAATRTDLCKASNYTVHVVYGHLTTSDTWQAVGQVFWVRDDAEMCRMKYAMQFKGWVFEVREIEI